MAKQRSSDGRLIYFHCSSISCLANALVRRGNKVYQLLEKHKTFIKILTKEFTLPAIAAVAKELLKERIFESWFRAKLRFSEVFQTSLTQEVERAASEAEIIRVEIEAVQGIVLTSGNEIFLSCCLFSSAELAVRVFISLLMWFLSLLTISFDLVRSSCLGDRWDVFLFVPFFF